MKRGKIYKYEKGVLTVRDCTFEDNQSAVRFGKMQKNDLLVTSRNAQGAVVRKPIQTCQLNKVFTGDTRYIYCDESITPIKAANMFQQNKIEKEQELKRQLRNIEDEIRHLSNPVSVLMRKNS